MRNSLRNISSIQLWELLEILMIVTHSTKQGIINMFKDEFEANGKSIPDDRTMRNWFSKNTLKKPPAKLSIKILENIICLNASDELDELKNDMIKILESNNFDTAKLVNLGINEFSHTLAMNALNMNNFPFRPFEETQKSDISKIDYYYNFCVKNYEKETEDTVLGSESLKSAYIPAYFIDRQNKRRLILDRIEEWFNEDSHGIMIMHGEPGQGKTCLCETAVYEFAKENRFENATNVFHFSLNPSHSLIINNNNFILSNSFCYIKNMILVKPDECIDSIIFLDGYDELKEAAYYTNVNTLKLFIETVIELAEAYNIHFIVTSRTKAIEAEINKISIDSIRIDTINYQEQENWIKAKRDKKILLYWNEYLKEFCKKESVDSELKKILGIPVIFRLIIHNRYKFSANINNIASLYEDIFYVTMKRHYDMCSKEIEKLDQAYCQLAYEIFCKDEDTAIRNDKSNDKITFYKFTYSYYLKQNSDKKEIGFTHRSFYQYYLAKYLYTKFTEIDSEQSAELYLSYLVERRIGVDIFILLQQILNNNCNKTNSKKLPSAYKYIISVIKKTDCIIDAVIKDAIGNGSKSRLDRWNNIIFNIMEMCFLYGLDMRYECGNMYLNNAYMSRIYSLKDYCSDNLYNLDTLNSINFKAIGLNNSLERKDLTSLHLEKANLIEADLRKAYLINTYLENSHMEGVHLEGAHLEGAHLDGAHLEGAHLDGAHMSGVFLNGTHLDGASFKNAYMAWADLINSHLKDVDFDGAYLDGAFIDEISFNVSNIDKDKWYLESLRGGEIFQIWSKC